MPLGRLRRTSSSGGDGGAPCEDEGHGTQVVRVMMWSRNQLTGAQLAKRSCRQFATVSGHYGVTALHVAAGKGWNKVCSWLLRHGADVNATDDVADETPLHYALQTGQIHTAVLLYKKGAKMLLSRSGNAPYHYLNTNQKEVDYFKPDVFRYVIENDPPPKVEYLPIRDLGGDEDWSYEPGSGRRRRMFRRKLSTLPDPDAMPQPVEKVVTYKEKRAEPLTCSRETEPWVATHSTLLYVFGENNSYNLGLASAKRYERPTLLEPVSRGYRLLSVSLSKYHTMALAENGTVKAWGHGPGGRLGTGTEETCVLPEQVILPQGVKIISIAAGADHSLFLSDDHEVFVCGLNQHFQLGMSDFNTNNVLLTPHKLPVSFCTADTCRGRQGWCLTRIFPSKFKSSNPPVSCSRYHSASCPYSRRKNVGVACSRYHSVAWCGQNLYTWGKNVGQLGHDESSVATPRRVSKFIGASKGIILMVSTCETATVVATSSSRLFLLNRYSISEITYPAEIINIQQLLVYGNADKPMSGSNLTRDEALSENWRRDVTILVLTRGGNIAIWKRSTSKFLQPPGKHLFVHSKDGMPVDLAMCSNGEELLIVTSKGELRRCPIFHQKGYRRHDFSEIPDSKMIQGVHRCCSIYGDSQGSNFAVITVDSFSKEQMPSFQHHPSLCGDLTRLLQEADLNDSLHDVILECHDKEYPAHKVVLASKSDYFKQLFSTHEEKDGNKPSEFNVYRKHKITFPCELSNSFVQSNFIKQRVASPRVVNLNSIGQQALEEMLTYIYTNEANFVCNPIIKGSTPSVKPVPNAAEIEKMKWEAFMKGDDDTSDCVSNHNRPEREFNSDKEYRKLVSRMISAVTFLRTVNPFTSNFSSHMLSVASSPPDMQFQAPDGSFGPCAHKCVLAIRADFFGSFFSSRWAVQEPSGPEGRLLLTTPHCHSAALPLFLQYAYTDKICPCDITLSLALDLIVLADEWLCVGAKTIAEEFAGQFINQRNFVSMFSVACNFNAANLKSCLISYAALNAPMLIETRTLENLRDEDLEEITVKFSDVSSEFIRPRTSRVYIDNVHYYFSKDGHSTEHVIVPPLPTLMSYRIPVESENLTSSMFRFSCTSLGYFVEQGPLMHIKTNHWDFYSVYLENCTQVQKELDQEEDQLEDAPPCPEYETRRSRYRNYRSSSESQDEEMQSSGPTDNNSDAMDLSGLVDRTTEDNDNAWQTVRRKNTATEYHMEDDRPEPLPPPSPTAADVRHSSSSAGLRHPKRRVISTGDPAGPSSLSSPSNRSPRPTITPVAVPGAGEKRSTAAKRNPLPSAVAPAPVSPPAASAHAQASASAAASAHAEASAAAATAAHAQASPAAASANALASPAAAAATSAHAQASAAAAPANALASPAVQDTSVLGSSAPEEEFPSLAASVAAARLQPKPTIVKPLPFPKKSQKQRKRQHKGKEEPATEKAPTASTPAWGSANSEAAQQQKGSDYPVLKSTAGAQARGRRRRDRTTSGCSSGPSESTSPQKSCATGHDFSKIMMEERTMDDNLNKSQRTSLDHIQMEEAAIAELYRHYIMMGGPEDEIQVVRAPSRPQAQPSWTDKHRPRYAAS